MSAAEQEPVTPSAIRDDVVLPSDEGLTDVLQKLRILVVDDEPTLRLVIGQALAMDGHEAIEASCAEDALDLFRSHRFHLVITDVMMGRMSGLDLLREVRCIDPDALVVIMTSQASLETATTALRNGAYDFLIKPFDDLIMLSALADRARDRLLLQARNRLLVEQLRTHTHELERLSHKLREMADRDGLTELFNHRYFHHALEREAFAAVRDKSSLSVVLLDVDHFKLYNDEHGHLAGDNVLAGLARILEGCAGNGAVCARYGGEEFGVIMPGSNRLAARERAEAMRHAVQSHRFASEGQPGDRITISLGISCCPGDGTTPTALIDRADEALYQAKQDGRNSVRG